MSTDGQDAVNAAMIALRSVPSNANVRGNTAAIFSMRLSCEKRASR